MKERTVISHWSFVIGKKTRTYKPPLIGRGCQPPAPGPRKNFSLGRSGYSSFLCDLLCYCLAKIPKLRFLLYLSVPGFGKSGFLFNFFGVKFCCFTTAYHDARLARSRMKIMLSIYPFYCRGLIYQARPGRFTHGFDESNPYDRIYITRTAVFTAASHDAAPSPGVERKPTQTVCAAYRSPMPWGFMVDGNAHNKNIPKIGGYNDSN